MTVRRMPGSRSIYDALQPQNSTLVNLPSETRNAIFEALCENATSVTICFRSRHKISPVEHALARTCRQLREEFLDVWTAHATDHASTIVLAVKNLEINDMGEVREQLAALGPADDGTRRSFVLRFHIDNTFERSLQRKQRQQHQMSRLATAVKFEADAVFDGNTLDIPYIEKVMHRYSNVPQEVLQAFLEAKKHFKVERAERKRAAVQAGGPDLDIGIATQDQVNILPPSVDASGLTVCVSRREDLGHLDCAMEWTD